MSTETTLNDVPNVASRLQGLRLATHGEDEDVTENATAGSSTATGASGSVLREPLRNITLSRARRALNFVGDEDQPTTSSSVARSEASYSNGDNRPPINAANTSYLEGRPQNTITLENSSAQNQSAVTYNWQGTKATMRERIVFLFNNEILSDVTFLVGRGAQQQRIPAHKLVLSSGSAVFDAMFNGTLATASSEIEVPDVEPAAFLAVLLFLYTDEIQIDPETVMTTLYTAKKYAVSALEKHCVDFLKNNLTSDNAFLLLTQARLFDEPQLASVCLDTIDRFTTQALNADGFTDIDIDTLMIVLERDTLHVRESKLFQAVLRWSEAECVRQQLPVTPENQRLVLGNALSLVRFPLMSKEEFTAGPAQSGLLNYSEVLSLFSYFILNPKPSVGFQTMPRCCMTGKEQTVCRFQHTKSRWGYFGTSDRIRFSVDRRIFLIGYGVYGSTQEPAIYEVSVELIHTASGKVIATNATSFSCDGSKYTYRLMFKELAEILPNTIYTASATFKGPCSYYGTKGLRTVLVDCDSGNTKVKFEFSSELGDNNGTSTDEGQIPELIFYTSTHFISMAKGKIKGSDSNNKIAASNAAFKNGETYTWEFEINETPPSARTLLTKGYTQDEINSYSGATVSTRGRFMTEQEKLRCPNERPLYLYIQGHTRHNVDLAIQKINEIIKTEHQSSLNRPSRFTNAPPPLMSLHSGITTVEKICVGIENAPQGFDLRGRILGAGDANLVYIRGETGANVTLRGRGSQFIDPVLGAESPEPLHLYIEHPKPEALQNAKQLAINLIQTIQSELQTYIQQQPPPVQPQQVIEQSQIPQTQFQTMNIGTLGQPNVVAIQHQDIIQHPQSNVVTLPATILTATVAGTPGPSVSVPPPGVHIPSHTGPLVPPSQAQEIQTFMPPPPVGQVQLIGPPSTVSQVQYQIHPGQSLQIQGIQGSQSSPQPMAQMYVMSQPPPQSSAQQSFITSSNASVSGAVSYVYTQPNMQRPATPSQGIIETVNVNLQQPPPAAPLNITQQPPPPLLHLHFPPPNFPPNQPPPPVPQTYQIQYQQVQAPVSQAQTQFVLQPGEHIVPPQLQQNHEQSQAVAQHIIPPQFEGHAPPFHLQVPPPPSAQTFLVPNAQSPQHHSQPPLPPAGEIQHQQEGPVEQGPLPQPVPPPQIVPPPSLSQMPNSMNILTSVPPPTQPPPPQNAPWLYQTQQPQQIPQPQGQLQMQMPPQNIPLHNVPPPQVQAQIQYHPQHIQYQNGHIPAQVHYTMQPPHQQFEQKPDSPEQQKSHGVKRRFSDVEGSQEPPSYQCAPLPAQRHGTGEGDRQQQVLHGPSPIPAGQPHGDRNKMLMPPPHPGEKRNLDQKPTGLSSGNEQNIMTESGNILVGNGPPLPPPPSPQAPWQNHHVRVPWGRPPPIPREGDPSAVCPGLPPINMPPPQIRSRGPADGNRSPTQSAALEQSLNVEYNQMPPYTTKPPPYNAHPLMQSICNPPPPPPPHHQPRSQHSPQAVQHYQVPISQTYQPPTSCPPWMN